MLPDPFCDQPVLHGARLRLEPLSTAVFEDYWAAMRSPEVTRLTGTHATFEREGVLRWLESRSEHGDRADWAILAASDGTFLGEAVVNELDIDNESASFRIWLADGQRGRGFGTEATGLVVDYALGPAGLHRLGLEVFAFNARAVRVYEKCGFQVEGLLRDALLWKGRRYDVIVMSILATDLGPGNDE